MGFGWVWSRCSLCFYLVSNSYEVILDFCSGVKSAYSLSLSVNLSLEMNSLYACVLVAAVICPYLMYSLVFTIT